MTRRTAPRPLSAALEQVVAGSAPVGVLGRLQAIWPAVAGPSVAAEAEPVSERSGTVTIACRSAVWAQELELLSADLLERLTAALDGPGGAPPITSLRFVVAKP